MLIARITRPVVVVPALAAVVAVSAGVFFVTHGAAPAASADLTAAATRASVTPPALPGAPSISLKTVKSGIQNDVRGVRMASLSQNWAGYVASGTRFRYVQATFTVPSMNCKKTPGTAKAPAMFADWVGLDGLAGAGLITVEQDGISGQCVRGAASYNAWWETYPKAPVYPRMTVSPGNVIKVTVYYSSAARQYQLTLRDLSNGEGFTTSRRCGARSCRNASAEVITESPSVAVNSNRLYPFADCGTSSFRNIAVTDAAGHRGGFASADWRNTELVMADAASHVKAATSGLSHGTAFKTVWERAN